MKRNRQWATVTQSEYEIREINTDGDAYNVDHFATKEDALSVAQARLASDPNTVAVVVEHCTSHYDEHGDRREADYTTVATFGDEAALLAGGWIEQGGAR